MKKWQVASDFNCKSSNKNKKIITSGSDFSLTFRATCLSVNLKHLEKRAGFTRNWLLMTLAKMKNDITIQVQSSGGLIGDSFNFILS